MRLTIVLGTIVIFSGGLVGCAPPVEGPYTIQHAQELEKQGRRTEAIRVYDAIVRENQRVHPDVAADALYRAGQYADDPNRYGATPELRNEGQTVAWQHWRQLRDEYPAQAKTLLHVGEPGDQLEALRRTIDRRNSADWKYQIIDTLVRLTGKNAHYSYALALIGLAVVVKLILLPFSKKQYKSQREMQQLQPLMKELQKKYKGTELSQKQMELYKEHGVNPFGGCLPMLFQMPFLIFIFQAIREYETAFARGKFLWIGSSLAKANPHLFGGNLAEPDVPLLVLYVLTNYATMRMSPAPDPQQQQQQNSMALMTSALFFYMFLSYKWSSAFVLYWFALNLFSIWQTYEYVYKPHKERMLSGGTSPSASSTTTRNGVGAAESQAKPFAEPTIRDESGAAAGRSGQTGRPAGAPPRVRPRKKKR